MPIHFDESLPAMVGVLQKELGDALLQSSVILREASGRLAFFAGRELEPTKIESVSTALRDALGPYARPDRVLADRNSPGAARILHDPDVRRVRVGSTDAGYLDRRIVGSDWLRPPAARVEAPKRFVFASLKGGVGRSTALSVIAANQASRGRRVLVIDLDLEAPGVGSMILEPDRRPELGVLDYLIDSSLYPEGDLRTDSYLGASGLANGTGCVDVAPVLGAASDYTPENYLSKLSRVMIEAVTPDGGMISVREKTRRMVDHLSSARQYDLVLIDARAGMAELAAGPILGLGARVLLFGTAQRQTLDGLRYLFAYLSTLALTEVPSPWELLQMVHAKASLDPGSHIAHRERLWDLFSEYLYEEQDEFEGFNFDVDDAEAPHYPVPVLLDTRFVDWDPLSDSLPAARDAYQATFGRLIEFFDNEMTPLPSFEAEHSGNDHGY